MFGERPDGDKVDAGFGELAQSVDGDVTGDFQLCLTAGYFHRFTHLLGVEVVEHDDIRASFQVLQLQLFQTLDTSTGTSGCSQKAFSTA